MTLLLYTLRKERALVENTDTVGGRLTGRVALVAGAASGIGRATTLRLAREATAPPLTSLPRAVTGGSRAWLRSEALPVGSSSLAGAAFRR